MNPKPSSPSIPRILWVDYPAFNALVYPVTTWIIYLIWVPEWGGRTPFITGVWATVFFWMAMAVTLFGVGVAGFRVYQFLTLFRDGEEVRGQIAAVDFRRDRGRVEYIYTYKGETYRSGAPLHRHPRARALKIRRESHAGGRSGQAQVGFYPRPLRLMWDSLSLPWRSCLEEAWAAYCGGTIPIGAVITDGDGNLLARGRNRIFDASAPAGQVCQTELAHAELNALLTLGVDEGNRGSWKLYTTTEPCPLCLGAFYMSGVRTLHYASREPWAGSVNLLGTTPYLARKSIKTFGPERADLEIHHRCVIRRVGTVHLARSPVERARENARSSSLQECGWAR